MILGKKEYCLTKVAKLALLKNLDREFKTRHLHYPINDQKFFSGIVELENSKFKIDHLFNPWQRFILPFAEGEFHDSTNESEILIITFKSPAAQIFFSGFGTLPILVFFLVLSNALNAILFGSLICLLVVFFIIRSEKNYYQRRKQRMIDFIDELLLANRNEQQA